ncbi:MAG: hypothetical protein V3S23_03950 [Kiloniellales bacterium]
MRTILAVLFAIPLLFAGADLADAAGKNKNKGKPAGAGGPSPSKGKSGDVATEKLLGTIITAVERALIGDYITKARSSGGGLPPGLAKRQQLPPGLQKHIQRTGRLPPGLEKRGLPSGLRGLLPYHKGKDYRVVGNDIMLIEIATGLILDIMVGALR